MGYVDSNLTSGEQVVYRTRKHWIIFWVPALMIVSFYLSAFTGVFTYKPIEETLAYLISASLYTIIFLALLYNHFRAAEFAITNKRILMKTGEIKVKSLNASLTKVRSMEVLQGPIGRIFNYGSISVRNARGTRVFFMFVSHPRELRKKLQEQIDLIQSDAKELKI